MNLSDFISQAKVRHQISEELLKTASHFDIIVADCSTIQEVTKRLGSPDWIDQPRLTSCRFVVDGKDYYRQRTIYFRKLKPLWLRITDGDKGLKISWGYYRGIWVAGQYMLKDFYPANIPDRYSLEQIMKQEHATIEWDKVREIEVVCNGESRSFRTDELRNSYQIYTHFSEGDEVLIKQ
jgi:hypothetical protein